MREPEEPHPSPADRSREPRRPPDTSWGVGPWPIQTPPHPTPTPAWRSLPTVAVSEDP